MLLLTATLAVAVGLALGLLGGGGSILTVPLLVYVAGMPAREAITASLVVVGTTAAVSAARHARAGRVHWRTGLLFGVAGTVGALAGGLAGGALPARLLLGAFAVLMVLTAVAMLRGSRGSVPSPGTAAPRPATGRLLVTGAGVGVVTGLLGAGGGFLVVPALALLAGLPIAAAVGTSVLVIALNSAAGLAGHLTAVPLDWTTTGVVTAAAVAGSLLGVHLVGRLPAEALRRGFGWFVLAMGALVLVLQAPPGLRLPAGLTAAGVAAVLTLCAALTPRCPLRPAHRTAPGAPA